MRLVYFASSFVFVSPLSCGRAGCVGWVGRVERVALRILLLLHHYSLSPLSCGRGGRVGWLGHVEHVALSILIFLHHNSSSAPEYLQQDSTSFLSFLVSGKRKQNPANMT